MSGIFDLTKVEKAIKDLRPSFVFVLDTNVIINNPDPAEWKVTGSPALFVLSDTVIVELEHITRRIQQNQKQDRNENLQLLRTIKRNLAYLFKSGSVADGIQTSGGWVISVASPENDALQKELERIDDIVKAFGASDAKMLLLTKECNQLSGPDLVTFITGETNLYNIAQTNNTPCRLHTKFPISDIKAQKKIFPALDWDKELLAIQSTIKRTSVAVELTLDSKRSSSDRVGSQIIVAEGNGIIKGMTENKPFSWAVKFHLGDFIELANAAGAASLGIEFDHDIPSAALDFADGEKPSAYLHDAIVEKLLECTKMNFTEGGLIFQPPDEIMNTIQGFEMLESANNPLSEEELEEMMKDLNDLKPYTWMEWISDKAEDEKAKYLSMVYLSVHNYWKMGQTYEFRIFI